MLSRLSAAEPLSIPCYSHSLHFFPPVIHSLPLIPPWSRCSELHLRYCRPRGTALIKTARQPTTMRFN